MRKQISATIDIIFSIIKRIDKMNRKDNIYFEINNKESDFDNEWWPIQQVSGGSAVGKRNTDKKERQHTARNDGQVSKKPQFLLAWHDIGKDRDKIYYDKD